MGEFVITGPQAVEYVNAVTTNNVAALQVGQIHYSGILNSRGTFEDDCLVYRAADHVLMVVNASNKDKDFAHIAKEVTRFDAKIEDVSDNVALLALQGPRAQEVLKRHTTMDLDAIKYYWFAKGQVGPAKDVIVSRTGYTGEDGFELWFDPRYAVEMWKLLTGKGDVMPAGLGCRDSLRLEMGMALYGNDIDDTTTPLEANLNWIVKMKKGDFTGRAVLERQQAAGLARKLVPFTFADRAFPRHGYPVYVDGQPSGEVRSGTMSPSLGVGIGTAYVPAAHAKVGNTLEVDVRGKRVVGTICETPFYKHGSHR
jgi:aminomethyltransferase